MGVSGGARGLSGRGERSRKQGGEQPPTLDLKSPPSEGERRNPGTEPCPHNPLLEQDGLIPFPPSPPVSSGPVSPHFPLSCSRPSSEGTDGQRALGCLGAGVHLLVGPELLVLLPAETLVVVAFALKQLLKVGFAVKLSMQCRVIAQAAEAEQLWSGRERAGRRAGAGQGRTSAWSGSACSRSRSCGK